MYRVALRSARSAVRPSPCFFSSSPFDGTASPTPTPPPPVKLGGRKKKDKDSADETVHPLHVVDIVESLSKELGIPKATCKSVVSGAFDFIGAVSPRFDLLHSILCALTQEFFHSLQRLWPIERMSQLQDLEPSRPRN